jgi:hypothetical protein
VRAADAAGGGGRGVDGVTALDEELADVVVSVGNEGHAAKSGMPTIAAATMFARLIILHRNRLKCAIA